MGGTACSLRCAALHAERAHSRHQARRRAPKWSAAHAASDGRSGTRQPTAKLRKRKVTTMSANHVVKDATDHTHHWPARTVRGQPHVRSAEWSAAGCVSLWKGMDEVMQEAHAGRLVHKTCGSLRAPGSSPGSLASETYSAATAVPMWMMQPCCRERMRGGRARRACSRHWRHLGPPGAYRELLCGGFHQKEVIRAQQRLPTASPSPHAAAPAQVPGNEHAQRESGVSTRGRSFVAPGLRSGCVGQREQFEPSRGYAGTRHSPYQVCSYEIGLRTQCVTAINGD